MKLKFLSILSVGVLGSLFLTGCSTVLHGGKTLFRNRENDYAHHAVVQPKAIKSPAGLPAIKTNPTYTMPKGQDKFPAEAEAIDLTPPGMNETVTPSGKVEKPTGKHAAVQAKLDQLKAQLAQLQAQEAAKKSGHALKATTAVPASSGKLIPSNIVFSKSNEGLLTIDAPFAKAWKAIPGAISTVGYTVTDSDKKKGVIHIQNKANPKLKLIVYVMPKVDQTQVSLFDSHSKLLSSNLGYSLLEQIKANLHD